MGGGFGTEGVGFVTFAAGMEEFGGGGEGTGTGIALISAGILYVTHIHLSSARPPFPHYMEEFALTSYPHLGQVPSTNLSAKNLPSSSQ